MSGLNSRQIKEMGKSNGCEYMNREACNNSQLCCLFKCKRREKLDLYDCSTSDDICGPKNNNSWYKELFKNISSALKYLISD